MTFFYPVLLVVAAVVVAGLVFAYRALDRRRTAALSVAGVGTGVAGAGRWRARWATWRRHLPPLLFVAGLAVLLVGLARPEATVRVPRVAGTVILAFDVSNSMMATDVQPSRLGAAQQAATSFVESQPATVDIGVVSFDQGAITAKKPTNDHTEVVAAINRLQPAGGTSLGQAILASLTAIVGKPVSLPDDSAAEAPAPDLGYWGSATIVLLSDGENTGGPDAVSAAELAGTAGVRIQTVGVGTVEGTTIEVNGYQVSTALNEDLLTQVAQATAGTYRRADDIDSMAQIYKDLDLRITSKPERMELTGAAVLLAVGLLLAGGLLMTLWHGRIL
ncbi:MAG TPA: VWA domain-containing protein [Micromonosporaceae bacterium]|jgi:Ca-activated chloride channel family protein